MEPTGHCPFVGLKQNRAIRFSSPTPEHRCYVQGDPIEIPVDQELFCLSRNHTQCPLYMGSSVPTTAIPLVPVATPLPASGLRGWMASLAPRDRLVYALMLVMLALVVAIYVIVGLQSLTGMPPIGGLPTALPGQSPQPPAATTSIAQAPTGEPSANPSATAPAATPTSLPTSTASPQPTDEPTRAPVYFPPTLTTAPPTADTSVAATAQALAASATAASTQAQATSSTSNTAIAQPSATRAPTSASVPTLAPPTATPRPKSTVAPTVQAAPTSAPAVPQPEVPLPPTPQPQPPATATPPPPVAETRSEVAWLYFGDSSGTLFVPVQRRVTVENRQSARAALQALLAGPRDGMRALVNGDTQLLNVRIEGGTAIANFDRDPGGERAYDAIVLTLTHFSSIKDVQIQVNGQNVGGIRYRPIVNPINPQGLPVDYGQTEFLPLYFVSNDGYYVRVIRMVPKTRQTAEGTVRALLEGPGPYSYALRRVIPDSTDLRGISIEKGVVTVDFTQAFLDTGERRAAVRTVTDSLTTLPNVRGVRILIEGAPVSNWWGEEYAHVFERSLVNAE